MTYLSAFVGDFRILTVPLTKNGVAYAPGPSSAHIFTVKNSVEDEDADAIIQKATGAGLEISGTNALITLYREDTEDLSVGRKTGRTFVFDVLELIDGVAELPNAEGVFTLKQRVTREQQTSVPVISTDTPLPFGIVIPDDPVAGNMLRVAIDGTLEQRTPAQVRSDLEIPTITYDGPDPNGNVTATHLGQWCKASTAWWQWNGFLWIPRFTLAGDPIAYNATLSAFRKLVVSGADGSEIITISSL